MNLVSDDHRFTRPSAFVAAGLVAGLAEVIWVAAYAAVTPLEAAEVARSITATFGAAGPLPATAGIAIHFVLSLALAGAFVALVFDPWRELVGPGGIVAAALALLAGIWAVNFFVVLPVLNPAFTSLMPLPVTLASKLLFALGLAATLQYAHRTPRRMAAA